MKIRNKIIKLLGGVPKEEFDELQKDVAVGFKLTADFITQQKNLNEIFAERTGVNKERIKDNSRVGMFK